MTASSSEASSTDASSSNELFASSRNSVRADAKSSGQGTRVARVITDVSGIDAEFDYLVPEKWANDVRIGTIVRVVLKGRRVRAWIAGLDVEPPGGVQLREITKVTGAGPPTELIELAGWAAWRWAGKRSFFLGTASPQRVVPLTSTSAPPQALRSGDHEQHTDMIVRLPPSANAIDYVLQMVAKGDTLVLAPTQTRAETVARRLRSSGVRVALFPEDWQKAASGGYTVVGTRTAAWAPMPRIAGFVVIDAHDEGLQSEASPTWNAVDVVSERARRQSVPCVLLSAVPRVEQLHGRNLVAVSRDEERNGWAPLHVIDLRHTDPRTGIYSPPLVELLRTEHRVICVLNRKDRSQLPVCKSCDELARCERCGAGMAITGRQKEDQQLTCRRCKAGQPVVCVHCGSMGFKQLRPGVDRVREDLESLALRPVGEVTGESAELPDADTTVLVGTEAVLHRVRKADAVVFLDFDQELLASRIRSAEDALVLLARASRIVGGRHRNGIVMVQTRQPEHQVIDAAVRADPSRLSGVEMTRRAELGWPPFSALATVSGAAAPDLVDRLGGLCDVMGPVNGEWMLRAPDHQTLCDALATAGRPQGRLRISVDPPRA